MYRNIAFSLLALIAVVHLIFGIVYVTAEEIMSYHAKALSTSWGDLESNYQTLLLALIKLVGAGGIVAGTVNLTLVLYFFRKPYAPIVWLAPFSALIFQAFMNYVVYQVSANTPGTPPLMPVTFGSIILVVAILLLFKCILVEKLASKGTSQ